MTRLNLICGEPYRTHKLHRVVAQMDGWTSGHSFVKGFGWFGPAGEFSHELPAYLAKATFEEHVARLRANGFEVVHL